jgi:hypothetical protein
LVLGLFLSPAAIVGASELTVTEALDAFEHSTKAIRNYDVSLTVTRRALAKAEVVGSKKRGKRDLPVFEWRPLQADEPAQLRIHRWRQVRDGRGRRRLELFDGAPNQVESTITFDGEIKRSLNEKKRQGYLGPTKVSFTQADEDYITFYANVLGEVPLVGILRERTGTHIVQDANDPGSIVLESPAEQGGSDPTSSYTVRLDAEHGLLPSQIDVRHQEPSGNGTFPWRSTVVRRFAQLENGAWAPIEVAVTSFVPSGPIKGSPNQEAVAVVDVNTSKWNTTLSDSLFTIAFPQGISVHDELRHITFVTGNVQREANLEKLMEKARQVVANPAQVTPPQETTNIAAWVILLLNVAVIAVVSFLIWRRRAARSLRT